MNVGVWDVTDTIQQLIRERVAVDDRRLADTDVPLEDLAPVTRGGPRMNRLERLHDAGVSIWLDTLSRELLDSGAFATLIADCAVTGATSNPTIFAKAITGSDRYDDQLRAAVAAGVRDPQELFFELALDDVGRAADLLRPPTSERRPRRLRLVRVHARPRRRHRGDDRAGGRAVEAARAAQRDDQGPRDRRPGSRRSRS